MNPYIFLASLQNIPRFNAEMEDEMTNLNTLMTIIRNVYLENTKLNDSVLNRLLLKDIWLTSDICLKYNIVDEVI